MSSRRSLCEIVMRMREPAVAPGLLDEASEILIEHGPHAVTQACRPSRRYAASRADRGCQAAGHERRHGQDRSAGVAEQGCETGRVESQHEHQGGCSGRAGVAPAHHLE